MNVPAMHRLKILPRICRAAIYLRCIKAPSRALCRCPFMCVMGVEHLHCEQILALNSWELNSMIGAIISASVYQTGNSRPTGNHLLTNAAHTHSCEHRRNSHSHLEVLCWAFILQLNCVLFLQWRLLVRKTI